MPERKISRSNIYVRQRGRLTQSQARALEAYSAEYLLEPADQLIDLQQAFGSNQPPTLEIGFGVGQALIEMAVNNPEKNFLGIEVYLPGIGALLHRCHEMDIHNVRVIRGDAKYVLENNCAKESLAQINIFFPDPWPKRKHQKRRIIQSSMIELIQQRLVSEGKVYLATDWEEYAYSMLELFSQSTGFYNLSPECFFTQRFDERPLTRFEARGIRLGHEVWDLCFQKKVQSA